MRFQKLSVAVVLAATWGCAGNDAVNIGDNQPPAKTGELLSDYAASWDGYTEANKFRSGSDRIRIELDDEGNGTVVLGDAAPPPPPTDPDAFYSPFGEDQQGPIYAPDRGFLEGFPYTIQHAVVREKRIQFAFDSAEIYKSWCELQVPVQDTSGAPGAPEYGCLPYYESAHADPEHCWIEDYQTGEDVEVNCVRFAFCTSVRPICTCNADGCSVPALPATGPANSYQGLLDAKLEAGGDSLTGTLSLLDDSIVRMDRQ